MASELGCIYNAGRRWTSSMIDIRFKHDYDEGILKEKFFSNKCADGIGFLQRNSFGNENNSLQNCNILDNEDIMEKLSKLTQIPILILKFQMERMKKYRLYANLVKLFTDENNIVTSASIKHFFKEILRDKTKRRHSLNTILSKEVDRSKLRNMRNDCATWKIEKFHSKSSVQANNQLQNHLENHLQIFKTQNSDNSEIISQKLDKKIKKNLNTVFDGDHSHSKRAETFFQFDQLSEATKQICELGLDSKSPDINLEKPLHVFVKKKNLQRSLKNEKSYVDSLHSNLSKNMIKSVGSVARGVDAKLEHIKSVKFADEIGLEIAQVRHIVDQNLPPMLTKNFHITSKTDYAGHRNGIEISCSKKMTPTIHKTQKKSCPRSMSRENDFHYRILVVSGISELINWKFFFEQPNSNSAAFRQRLISNNVCLENVFASTMAYKVDVVRLYGKIKVRNLTFEKEVGLRITTDNWKSFKDYNARYWKDISGKFCDNHQNDTFVFSLPIRFANERTELPSPSIGALLEFEFAVFYQAGSHSSAAVYWDNNNGCNYAAAKVMQ